MYIKQLKINNIRSIDTFEMTFPNPAGWHVLIGDNGAGKSTIVRAIAAALIGPAELPAARLVWKDWLKKGEEEAFVDLHLEYDRLVDLTKSKNLIKDDFVYLENHHFVLRTNSNGVIRPNSLIRSNHDPFLNKKNCFSAGYGPFRRFTGGDESKNVIFESSPIVGAHLSLFGEDVALTEALNWLKELNGAILKPIIDKESKILKRTEKQLADFYELVNRFNANEVLKANIIELEKLIFDYKQNINNLTEVSDHNDFIKEVPLFLHLKSFLNKSELLPHNTQFQGFDDDGNIIFTDGRGNSIPVVEMSDGYRSILSLLFDLIRQLIRVYGEDAVLENIKKGEMNIPLPGIVLIDEVDAHLHPTWQTRIGEWFTQYFPQIQFIVTTHSPLVCRAAKKGSIWQLAAPVNGGTHREITGIEKERLIYGNILDAYGTELFGQSPVRSEASEEKKARLGKLNTLFALGKISKKEEKERQELLKILSTDDPTGF